MKVRFDYAYIMFFFVIGFDVIFSRLCSNASELHILLVEANQRLLWTCNVIILNKVQDTLALLFTISQTFWTFHCILLAELLVKMLSLTCISLLAEFPPPPWNLLCFAQTFVGYSELLWYLYCMAFTYTLFFSCFYLFLNVLCVVCVGVLQFMFST